MLVQEYLFMMAELRGVAADKRERSVADAVTQTGLHKHLVHPIATLSKGYRQRVGIAQAIVHKPPDPVPDEPTHGPDPEQLRASRDLIKRLGQTTTILLSTHILQEIEAVCDRVLVMINGKLVADAPLTTLLQSNTLRLAVKGDEVERKLRMVERVANVRKLG